MIRIRLMYAVGQIDSRPTYMALVQSAINIIVGIISLPIWIFSLFAHYAAEDKVGAMLAWVFTAVAWVVSTVLLFLGNLVAKAFSRQREFKADRLAADLVSVPAMVNALTTLRNAPAFKVTREQAAFAALKIHSSAALWDIFSTHPSLERRIEALQSLASTDAKGTTALPANGRSV